MIKKTIDSIIFDLDGTLWDAAGTCTQAWNASLKQLNAGSVLEDDFVRSVSGLKIDRIFQDYFHFIPQDQHAQLLELYKNNERRLIKELGGSIFPLVKETLHSLHEHYRLFIVSNCLSGYIEDFMQFHQLQNLFSDFECSGNTGQPKSANIQLVMARNQLQNPAYVGDTVWDYEATVAAHVPFIFAAYGFGKVEDAKWKISEFAQLPLVLSKMGSPEN